MFDSYAEYEYFRELLEFASKAVGYTKLPIEGWSLDSTKGMRLVGSDHEFVRYWNPLQDDGDNARLEAVLGIDVEWDEHSVRCSKIMPLTMDDAVFRGFYEDHDGDRQAARRMASLRVAAVVGKAMK